MTFPARIFSLAECERVYDAQLLAGFSPYLGTVADKCWQLVTRGIIEENIDPLRLSQVYVNLNTTGTKRSREARPEESEPLSALEALFGVEEDGNKHVVLLGAPGSGKSTFFQFITLCLTFRHSAAKGELAKKHFADLNRRLPALLHEQATLPFRVILREFGPWLGDRRGTADEVSRYLRGPIEALGYREAASKLAEALERGLAFVLFDGLDEVPAARVAEVKKAIASFAEGIYGGCRVAVTCRTESYKKAEFKLGGDWAIHEVAPLSSELQKEFVTNWYAELELTQPQFKGEGAGCAATLIRALDDTRLKEMAGNPFFLTAMAAMHRPGEELPNTGAELMDRVVNSVLKESRRQRSTGREESSASEPEISALLDRAEISIDDLRSFLERIAYRAREMRSDKNGRFVEPALLKAELGFSEAVTVEEWLDTLRHRAGLLQSQDGRNFEFAYRFEEFLAGCNLAKSNAWLLDPRLSAYHLRAADLLERQGDYGRNPVLWSAGFIAHVQRGERVKIPALVATLAPETIPAQGANREAALFGLRLAEEIAQEARMGSWKEQLVPGKDSALTRLRACLEQVRDNDRDLKTRAFGASAIGRLGDSRYGIRAKEGVPEIDWVELPKGKFVLGETKKAVTIEKPFKISRYPITVAQYQAFLDDPQGYRGERHWAWKEAPEMLKWWKENGAAGPEDYAPVFQTPNHPRVGVCWFEAAAFCRWLTEVLRKKGEIGKGEEIHLPHEKEWEWAARCVVSKAKDGTEVAKAHEFLFPWQSNDEKDLAERCNWHETGIGSTSAVGLFPKGRAPCGAMDMSGNVWEWCENWYDEKEKDYRVLRGGSWGYLVPEYLRATDRYYGRPGIRNFNYGFRVVMRVSE